MRKSPLRSWAELIALAIGIGVVVGIIAGTALVVVRGIGGLLG